MSCFLSVETPFNVSRDGSVLNLEWSRAGGRKKKVTGVFSLVVFLGNVALLPYGVAFDSHSSIIP
jgi:hypothetical protein